MLRICSLTLVYCAVVLAIAPRPAAAQGTPPTPEWIWLSKTPGGDEMAYFRQTFAVKGKVKSAMLVAACDNSVSIFVNGKLLAQHESWERPFRENIAAKLVEGENVIALRCKNGGGPAGAIVKLVISTDDAQQYVISNEKWLANGDPKENWREVKYDASEWKPAVSLGKIGVAPWDSVSLDSSSSPVLSTPEDVITAAPGFKVELLYSVPKAEQGSWVSMTPDPKGRLICSDQQGLGLYRITPGKTAADTKVEKLTVAIGDAQGLLHVDQTLYVTVNGGAAQGSGFYAVRDTNGDDQYDEVKLLKKFAGGGEHGPHAIRRGPDGKLYILAGNHTKAPDGLSPNSPHRNWDEDLLLPRNPDGNGHATGVMAPGGWVVRTDLEGKEWDIFCAGFRNPYDIDFNQDGELFTYDADMEWDTGTPWYRPTRVNHCTSAAEFGWRFGTGKWPAYYVDSVGAVVDIGLGCPTGIEFGTGAKFPAKYQRALFINDWTYGKIYAIHMTPSGAGYTAAFEAFVQGKPLPVTDISVNPVDGALYFTIGGRGTQSGFYRVTYTGKESTERVGPAEDAVAAKARELRRKLESFHGRSDDAAIEFAWPHLNSSDRAIRYAARVAVEHQDLAKWRDKALAEPRLNAAIQALTALCRAGGKDPGLQAKVLTRLNALPIKTATSEQMLDLLRVYQLAFIRLGGKDAANTSETIARLSPLFPAADPLINRELVQVLVYLDAPGVVDHAMKLLAEAQTQQDQLHYVFVLRNAKPGWTADQRKAYFSWMNLGESKYRGGASFKRFIEKIRKDAVEKLTPEEQTALAEVIAGKQSVEVVKLETTRQFVHNWQLEDLEPMLAEVEKGRSFENGRLAYEATQCAKCHRFAGDGASTGPDITTVGNRFSPLYLLESFISPSKVVSDQYRGSTLLTADGNVLTGRIVDENDKVVRMRTNPFAVELTEIPKDQIEERSASPLSEMPTGLLNVLTKEEVLDLIAYLRSGGNPDDKAFKK